MKSLPCPKVQARTLDGWILLEGLGFQQVGRMWVRETDRHESYPGYEAAPIYEGTRAATADLFGGRSLFEVNLEAESTAARQTLLRKVGRFLGFVRGLLR